MRFKSPKHISRIEDVGRDNVRASLFRFHINFYFLSDSGANTQKPSLSAFRTRFKSPKHISRIEDIGRAIISEEPILKTFVEWFSNEVQVAEAHLED